MKITRRVMMKPLKVMYTCKRIIAEDSSPKQIGNGEGIIYQIDNVEMYYSLLFLTLYSIRLTYDVVTQIQKL